MRDNDRNRAPSTGDYFSISCRARHAVDVELELDPADGVLHPGGHAGEWQPHGRLTLRERSITHGGQSIMNADDRRLEPSWHDRHFSRRRFLAGAAGLSAGAMVGRQLPTVAHAAEAGDGLHGVQLRGMYLTSKDRLAEGRFGAMFKKLPAFAPRDDLLDGLAQTMVEDQTIPDDSHLNTSPRLFAGFTFIGQFIDHDITFDNTPLAQQQADPDATRQLPDAALRPRLGLRARAGERAPVLRSGRPRTSCC